MAVGAGFEARGMARAMVVIALAQLAVGAIALIGKLGGPVHVAGLTGMFAALFVAAAWLFRRATGSDAKAVARAEG